jgi:hypothetical protein
VMGSRAAPSDELAAGRIGRDVRRLRELLVRVVAVPADRVVLDDRPAEGLAGQDLAAGRLVVRPVLGSCGVVEHHAEPGHAGRGRRAVGQRDLVGQHGVSLAAAGGRAPGLKIPLAESEPSSRSYSEPMVQLLVSVAEVSTGAGPVVTVAADGLALGTQADRSSARRSR